MRDFVDTQVSFSFVKMDFHICPSRRNIVINNVGDG